MIVPSVSDCDQSAVGARIRVGSYWNRYRYKYQLPLINPHDGILLQTELDDHCDKLAVDNRSSPE